MTLSSHLLLHGLKNIKFSPDVLQQVASIVPERTQSPPVSDGHQSTLILNEEHLDQVQIQFLLVSLNGLVMYSSEKSDTG